MDYSIENGSEDTEKCSLPHHSGFVGYLQHEIHGATPILLFIPLNDHSLERFSSVSCVEPSFVPTSWFHGCLDLAIGMSPFQDFCTCLFSGPIHREA